MIGVPKYTEMPVTSPQHKIFGRKLGQSKGVTMGDPVHPFLGSYRPNGEVARFQSSNMPHMARFSRFSVVNEYFLNIFGVSYFTREIYILNFSVLTVFSFFQLI